MVDFAAKLTESYKRPGSWLVPDFETSSQADLKKVGAWRYAEDITTEVLCLSFETDSGYRATWYPGQPIPAVMRAAIEGGVTIFVAHNSAFEKAIWRHIMVKVHGWPDLPNSRWHCTQARAANLALPQALEKVLKVMNLPVQKDMDGNRLTLSMSKVNKKTGMLPVMTPAIQERIGTYCMTDVKGQVALHRRLGWLSAGEREVWLLNQRVNERGLCIDRPLVDAMQEVVDRASEPLRREFADLTGGLKMTQAQAVKSWMLDQGVMLPDMTKETLASVLGEPNEGDEDFEPDPDLSEIELPPNVERALRIRQLIGSSSVTKLSRMRDCAMQDGCVRGLLQYHGTGPGRSAGRLLQPHNFPRGSEEVQAMDVEEKVKLIMTRDPELIYMATGIQPVEFVVGSLRNALIARPGRVYLAGDYSGIQARTVLALAGQHDKTALMASGVDVYIDMACTIWPELPRPVWSAGPEVFKAQVKEFKAKHPEKRQTGKNSVLGCGFQMGAPKFMLKYMKEATLEEAKEVIDAYRGQWAPKVPEVWHDLQYAALEAVKTGVPCEAFGVEYRKHDQWLAARLPSGRDMWYFNPQLVRRHMPWSTEDEPDVRLAWTYQAMKMGRLMTIDAFGGQLTENVVMGMERDVMTHAQLLMEKNNFPVVLEVHDEIVAEPLEKGLDEAAFKQIMLDVQDWAKHIQIPIAIEAWQSPRYKK